MSTIEKYEAFLKKIASEDPGLLTELWFQDYIVEANGLLKEAFKEKVIFMWGYKLDNEFQDKEDLEKERAKYKTYNRVDFVADNRSYSDGAKFITENWDKIDEILGILREYITELEKEESKCTEH